MAQLVGSPIHTELNRRGIGVSDMLDALGIDSANYESVQIDDPKVAQYLTTKGVNVTTLPGFAATPSVPGFDPQFYLQRYPDIAKAGIDPLKHYLQYGQKEGRSINAAAEQAKIAARAPATSLAQIAAQAQPQTQPAPAPATSLASLAAAPTAQPAPAATSLAQLMQQGPIIGYDRESGSAQYGPDVPFDQTGQVWGQTSSGGEGGTEFGWMEDPRVVADRLIAPVWNSTPGSVTDKMVAAASQTGEGIMGVLNWLHGKTGSPRGWEGSLPAIPGVLTQAEADEINNSGQVTAFRQHLATERGSATDSAHWIQALTLAGMGAGAYAAFGGGAAAGAGVDAASAAGATGGAAGTAGGGLTAAEAAGVGLGAGEVAVGGGGLGVGESAVAGESVSGAYPATATELGGTGATTTGGGGLTLEQIAQGAGVAGTALQVAGGGDTPAAPAAASSDPYGGSTAWPDDSATGTPSQGAPGLGGALGSGSSAATGAGTALSRMLDGTATDADWLSIMGTAGSTALGYLGSRDQTQSLERLSREYMAMGAPSRARYESSFDPGFKLEDMPGYQQTLDTSYDTMLRRLSTKGNPYGSPGGLTEAMKYVTGNVGLPALQNYRSQNANAGGLSRFSDAAPGVATSAIGSQANIYNTLGSGLAELTQPRRRTLADYMAGLT